MRRVPSAVSGIGGENVSAKRYEGLIFSAFPFAAFVTKNFPLIEMRGQRLRNSPLYVADAKS